MSDLETERALRLYRAIREEAPEGQLVGVHLWPDGDWDVLKPGRVCTLEEAAAVVDQCNREGPYNAIGAASRIRALASVDRSPEGQDAQRLDAEHESAVTAKPADAQPEGPLP